MFFVWFFGFIYYFGGFCSGFMVFVGLVVVVVVLLGLCNLLDWFH